LTDVEKVNILALDPGHVNIFSGLRKEPNKKCNPKDAKMKYCLTNRRNQTQTGFLRRKKASQKKRDRDVEFTQAIEALSNNSSRTWDPGKYLSHLLCYVQEWKPIFKHVYMPYIRHFRFANYQAKQRRVNQIAAEMKGSTEGKLIVVIGDGVHSATSRGHDAAPGKMLRRQLSKFLPIVMSNEQGTSARSACCHLDVIKGVYDANSGKKAGHKIRGILHCPCGATWNRDLMSSLSILNIFLHQASTKTNNNPMRKKRGNAGNA